MIQFLVIAGLIILFALIGMRVGNTILRDQAEWQDLRDNHDKEMKEQSKEDK